MNLWKKIKKALRQLAGKDLPKSVIKEPEPPRWVPPKQAPLREPLITKPHLSRIDVKAETKRILEKTRREVFPYDGKLHKTTLEERTRQEWLPKPTTKRRTRDKTHRPPAAQHNISHLMKAKGGRHSRYYHQTIKKSPGTKIEEEEN